MARPSEYNYEFLKQYKGISVIYGLYTKMEGVRYVGHSTNVYTRFKNHLYGYENESNPKKINWINKNKGLIRIKILSDNHMDWEEEEKKWIKEFEGNKLVNICAGGKNNVRDKKWEDYTDEEHCLAINKSLREMNRLNEKKGKAKRFKLLTKEDIQIIIGYGIQ